MSENGVEHQATVDKGLKMKIKRKQTASKTTTMEPKTKQGNEETTKIPQRNSTNTNNNASTTAAESECKQPLDEDAAGTGNAEGQGQKSMKRKRGNNNKNGKPKESEVDEKPSGGDVESVQGRGRDPSNANRERGIGERSSKRPTGNSTQDFKDFKDDQEHPQNKSGNKNTEAEISLCCNNQLDLNFQSEVSEKELQSSDPYEFVTKVEDQPPTTVKKFKGDEIDSEVPVSSAAVSLSSSSSSSSSPCMCSKMKCDVGMVTCSVGVMTDPDCLGPCDPGTSVILEGIVWSESNNGILVVNVTWRGKTYVGTLMDATKHHWASPRFREESPSAELEYRAPKSKRGTPVTDVTERRRLRKCRRPATSSSSNGSGSGSNKMAATRQSPPIVESNGRNKGRVSETVAEMATDAIGSVKRARLETEDNEETFYKCIAPECSKKFKHISGLRYHQSQAHRKQSNASVRKSESSLIAADASQDKGKMDAKKDESLRKVSCDATANVCPVLGCDVTTDVSAVCSLEILSDETMNEVVDEKSIPCSDVTKLDERSEVIGLSGDDGKPFHGTRTSFGDPVTINTLGGAVESIPTTESMNKPLQHSTENILESVREDPIESINCEPIHPYVITPNFQNIVKHIKMESSDSSVTSEPKEMPKSILGEIEFEHPDGGLCKSPSRSTNPFHKPILHTPDVGRHKVMHRPLEKSLPNVQFENGQSAPVSCPPNSGLKLSPSGGCSSEDKSPVYSDISDANDGVFNENELRLRRAERDSKRIPKMEKSVVRRFDDYSRVNHRQSPNVRLSPFSSPVIASSQAASQPPNKKSSEPVKSRDLESEQLRKAVGIPPLSKTPASVAKPSAPQTDRYRTDKSVPGSSFNADMLKAQESSLLWMEMLQRSNLTPTANMVPYGYAVDPLAHMRLMASNPEYRNQYERWYMGQQCYRQLLQAESEKCMASDKPVDMSAKPNNASSISNNASDSKADVRLHLRLTGNGVEERMSSERQKIPMSVSSNSYTCNEFSQTLTHSHNERNTGPRNKPLVPKQESGLLLMADRDEKPLDLMNPQCSANKVKGKQLDNPCFASASPNHSVKSKVPPVIGGNAITSNQSNQLQDLSKASPAPQTQYEGNFPSHFPGFQGPSYLDSSLAASGNHYPVGNSKYPMTGNEKSIPSSSGQTRKAGQSVHSAKDIVSPSEKNNDSRRQNADSFDFQGDGSTAVQDKSSVMTSGHNSPLTLRHLHTHHHTHVVGAAPYSIYGSYSGLMSPVPTIVPSVVPVIAPTYIPK